MHTLFEDGQAAGGLWKTEPDGTLGEVHELPARETIVVLEGTVRIEIQGMPTLELAAGDMASMPKGAITTWHPSPEFKEIWLYS
jgi:uncharacterized cupin superfamily protein